MLQSGNLAAASDYFSGIVQREPSNGPAFGYLGIALTKLGQTEQALQALGQASQLQPQEPTAQYNVAIGLMHAGRQQDAIPFLNYTLQLDPNHTQAQAALASFSTAQAPPQPEQPAVFGSMASPLNNGPAPISGQVYPASQPQGMHYTQTARPRVVQVAPDLGTRLTRGLGWGALYGQWWTAWMMFWTVAWNFKDFSMPGLFLLLAVFVGIFTVGGVVAGLIIAVLPPAVSSGAAVGVTFGIIFCVIEMLLNGSAQMIVNIFFWFFTGRYVGANIAVRVHRPIQQ